MQRFCNGCGDATVPTPSIVSTLRVPTRPTGMRHAHTARSSMITAGATFAARATYLVPLSPSSRSTSTSGVNGSASVCLISPLTLNESNVFPFAVKTQGYKTQAGRHTV